MRSAADIVIHNLALEPSYRHPCQNDGVPQALVYKGAHTGVGTMKAATGLTIIHGKERHNLLQLHGLAAQFFCGGGKLFGTRCILLCGFIQLTDRIADLADALGLLF